MGVKNTERQQSGKAFSSHVNEWLVTAMSTHFLAQSAQLASEACSGVPSSGAYTWNDALLRIFEVMLLCVFFVDLLYLAIRREDELQNLAPVVMCRQRTRESGSFASLPQSLGLAEGLHPKSREQTKARVGGARTPNKTLVRSMPNMCGAGNVLISQREVLR